MNQNLYGQNPSKPNRPGVRSLLAMCTLAATLLLSGCGGSAISSQPPTNTYTPPPANTNTVPNTTSTANVVSGTVVDTQGNPVSGADIVIVGISSASGDQIRYTSKTDASGAYSVQVTNGNYHVYAFVSVNYMNTTWSLQLNPKDHSNETLDSSNGINKDFQWALHGQMPGNDGTTYDDYYGAAITVNLSVLSTIPAGSTFTFTLTPNGPLIDSSTGQTITVQKTQQDLSVNQGSVSLDHTDFLYDIPIGDYTISGQLTGSDGTTQTILFDGSQSEEISWANLSQPNVHIVGLQHVNISVGGQ